VVVAWLYLRPLRMAQLITTCKTHTSDCAYVYCDSNITLITPLLYLQTNHQLIYNIMHFKPIFNSTFQGCKIISWLLMIEWFHQKLRLTTIDAEMSLVGKNMALHKFLDWMKFNMN
jgi:hypothetical protein